MTATGDHLNTPVPLGPLQLNGGQTPTLALVDPFTGPANPAIDKGDNNTVPPLPTTDQRGPGFNRQINGTVDIGAFESQLAVTAPTRNPRTINEGATPTLNLGSFTDQACGEQLHRHHRLGRRFPRNDLHHDQPGDDHAHGAYLQRGELPGGKTTVTVTVNDAFGDYGQTSFLITVAEVPVVISPVAALPPINEGTSTGNVVVATFTDPAGAESPLEYAATIFWGDGSSSAGVVTNTGGNTFSVSGSHTYGEESVPAPPMPSR